MHRNGSYECYPWNADAFECTPGKMEMFLCIYYPSTLLTTYSTQRWMVVFLFIYLSYWFHHSQRWRCFMHVYLHFSIHTQLTTFTTYPQRWRCFYISSISTQWCSLAFDFNAIKVYLYPSQLLSKPYTSSFGMILYFLSFLHCHQLFTLWTSLNWFEWFDFHFIFL